MIQLQDVTLALGHHPPLLEGVNLTLHPGERVALVGRNGAGKSTLLQLIEGTLEPDAGTVHHSGATTVARLEQHLPEDRGQTVRATVAEGVGELGAVLQEYHRLAAAAAGDPTAWEAMERCQDRLDAEGGWHLEQRIDSVLTRLELAGETPLGALSGGLQRRALLGRALVRDPDVLLLDEPTNHLDIDGIRWLEEELRTWPGTLLFITHDRAFLRRLATRIVELDRGRINEYPGDYDLYLKRRAEELDAEARRQAVFDRKLAQEEAWIRQGVKARRTRNQGRVRELQSMRAARARRRESPGQARIRIQEAERSGKIVAEADGVGYEYADGVPVVRSLNTTLLRGDRLGLIGPNGCGKTTLVRLFTGDLEPTEGTLHRGARNEVIYFDQRREALDEDASVQDNVGGGRETVHVNGRERHVLGYLQDFLFEPRRARQPARVLSGGERNRLLLARLFLRPSNVLVMDEPTNDLDSETLDLLEERIHDYAGTVLLVSHDREFLDNVVTHSLVYEGDAFFREYPGGYSEWLRHGAARSAPSSEPAPAKNPAAAEGTVAGAGNRSRSSRPSKTRAGENATRRLSSREEQELDGLPDRIHALEERQAEIHAALGDPTLYREECGSAARRAELDQQRQAIEEELEQCLARWETLEQRKQSGR